MNGMGQRENRETLWCRLSSAAIAATVHLVLCLNALFLIEAAIDVIMLAMLHKQA